MIYKCIYVSAHTRLNASCCADLAASEGCVAMAAATITAVVSCEVNV